MLPSLPPLDPDTKADDEHTPPSERALGLARGDWERLVATWSLPAYRGRQIFDAIHRRGIRDYGAVLELPRELRERLAAAKPLTFPEIAAREESADGSRKYGLRLADGALVEAVWMPGEALRAQINEFADARATGGGGSDPGSPAPATAAHRATNRFTVCLSSQTGCAVDCAFCVTGRLGGGRDLSAAEILGQLSAVLADSGATTDGLRVVFMGMGEPFLNPGGVIGALEVLFDLVPARRITVSTSGVTPAFVRFAALDPRPNLAVSLNAADQETRVALMPITRTYPLEGLVAAMRAWPRDARRPITAEYVLIAGANDSRADALRLSRLLSGMNVKVNVIPLNEDPTYLAGWKRPDEAAISAFARALAGSGTVVTVRRSRGPDARAACGQLKGRTVDPRKRRS